MGFPPDGSRLPSHFRVGDVVEFEGSWDPGFAPDDPFYQEPVPAGTRGQVTDVGKDHVRVRLDDRARWPSPLLVWQEGRFPDPIEGGLGHLRKVV